MFNLFSYSSSSGRRPNPHQGSSYYQRKGFFGNMKNFGSFSSSSGKRRAHSRNNYSQVPPHSQPHSQARPGGVCPACGSAVPAGSKFCLSCGAKIETTPFCTNCGKPLPANARFCPECGAKAP